MFVKNALRLISGTVIAQLLPFLVLPFLTRTMSSEDFGVYSLFFTSTMMFGALTALRYEYAINASKSKTHAEILFALSVALNLVFLPFCFIIVAFLVKQNILDSIWLLLPFSCVLMSLNQAFYMLANYTSNFTVMSQSRIINAAVCALVQFTSVLLLDWHQGAFFGVAVGFLCSTLFLWKYISVSYKQFRLKKLRVIFLRYIVYPKFIFPGAFINFFSANLPVYIIGFLFGPTQAGYYSLAIRVASAPTTMIGRSIGEVFRNKASQDIHNYGSFSHIFNRVALASIVVSLTGFSLLYVVVQPLFELIFGVGWDISALYVQILIPMLVLQFVTAPIGYSLMLVNKQKQEFYWQIFRLALVCFLMFLMYEFSNTALSFVVAASVSLTISFIVYFYLCYKNSQYNIPLVSRL